MDVVDTGIVGLQSFVEGVPRDGFYTVTGKTGSGKSLFGLQFLYTGASVYNEAGMYIYFEENKDFLKSASDYFGWDIYEQQEQGKLIFVNLDPKEYEKFNPGLVKTEVIGRLSSVLGNSRVKRVVIDPISSFGMHMSEADLRETLIYLKQGFADMGITTFIISESHSNLTRFGVEEFLSDGVFEFGFREKGSERERYLRIWKLMGSNIPLKDINIRITNLGIEVSL